MDYGSARVDYGNPSVDYGSARVEYGNGKFGVSKILLQASERSVVVRWGKYFVFEDGKLQTFATI